MVHNIYLKGDQWEYDMNHFGLEYIPSYLLYNKEGKLIKKYTPFPGNKEVKETINSLSLHYMFLLPSL